MISKVSILVLLSFILISMADSSESSDDDHKSKEEPSGDDPKETESDKGKDKNKKEEKNKNGKNYDDYDESQLDSTNIDEMFLGKLTEKPSSGSEDHSEKTTIEPPQGVFGPNYWNNLANAGGSETTKSPETETENESKDEEESHETRGTNGNPFYPYPRPIDIWDRLFVLAAFPICFFAVMLKAEMFR